jgi:hypothetical protein
MTTARKQLRELARLALEQRDYRVAVHTVAGAAPGARLIATKASEKLKVAVRTSLVREAGFMRSDDGIWQTISDVDLVMVAVPSASSGAVDIYCFERNALINHFEKCLAARKRPLSFKAPVFVALDDLPLKNSTCIGTGLGRAASWKKPMFLDEASPISDKSVWDAFVRRVTRAAAKLIGVDAANISVEFRIVGKSGAVDLTSPARGSKRAPVSASSKGGV